MRWWRRSQYLPAMEWFSLDGRGAAPPATRASCLLEIKSWRSPAGRLRRTGELLGAGQLGRTPEPPEMELEIRVTVREEGGLQLEKLG